MALAFSETTILPNLATLRSISRMGLTTVIVAGAVSAGDGGGGIYYLDDVDKTSADNGTTMIVTVYGDRWKSAQPPGNVKHTDFQAPAVTGNFSVTGIGFKPRAIEIKTAVNSLTAIYQSTGVFGTGLQRAYFSALDLSGRSAGPVSDVVISVKDILGVTSCVASVVSLDNNGFTLNFTSVSLRPWCLVTCYS